ncbi:CD1871A family CXXC motif-containing protein [Pleomorphochaeta sp. DL1XJH-081]|jgi:hypothetical protein|uniref:CD1871A family CXXC motif-containing protein n=1 Tax=Pleomorphochaeta sp. DL1XJH-081 TaxID=3409690 RepID=UPI003BB646C4
MEKHNRINTGTSRLISGLLIVVGLIAIVVGVVEGEALIVLKKATLICLECIGLG